MLCCRYNCEIVPQIFFSLFSITADFVLYCSFARNLAASLHCLLRKDPMYFSDLSITLLLFHFFLFIYLFLNRNVDSG